MVGIGTWGGKRAEDVHWNSCLQLESREERSDIAASADFEGMCEVAGQVGQKCPVERVLCEVWLRRGIHKKRGIQGLGKRDISMW